MDVRIARFHNVYGPEGTWDGGREKAPAAICRKVAVAMNGGHIEMWGDEIKPGHFFILMNAWKVFED